MESPRFEKVKYQLNILIDENYTNFEEIKSFYNKFTYKNDGDSGIDLYNDQSIVIDALKVGTINYNIKCEMINLENNTFVSYYLAPRSSISKTPFQMANSFGIIDAGFRGNLVAKITNISFETDIFPKGSLCQIISADLKPIKIKIVEKLSDTSRGANGFGSTNI
jgi:dUTP pyrophosphatase